MLTASPHSDYQALDDCCADDMLGDAAERRSDRSDRNARRPRSRAIEDRVHAHNQVLLDRTLRSQEKAALRRGLKLAQNAPVSNSSSYTNTTRIIFVFAVVLIFFGLGTGAKFFIGSKMYWLIACAGLLSLGFGLLSVAARKGASEASAQ